MKISRAQPRLSFAVLLGLLLSACSSLWPDTSASTPPPAVPAIAPPGPAPLQEGFTAAAKEAKLAVPIEISAIRRTEFGPGDYFVCLREANPAPGAPRLTYSVFFTGDAYKGSRQSVIREACEAQSYLPASLLADKPPPPPVGVSTPDKTVSPPKKS